jgi:hypothetical protein
VGLLKLVSAFSVFIVIICVCICVDLFWQTNFNIPTPHRKTCSAELQYNGRLNIDLRNAEYYERAKATAGTAASRILK